MREVSQNAFPEYDLTYKVIGSAMQVHRTLGPGLLEKLYEKALCVELKTQGLQFQSQQHFEVIYKGTNVGDYFADIVVENKVILEVKAVKELTALHQAQLLNYLKISRLSVGLIINFSAKSLEYKRLVIN